MEKYSSIDPSKVTVKYIFTEGNTEENELDAFVENCKKYNLNNCNYQISLNFKKSKLEFEILKSVTYLFYKLSTNGFKKIFLDDHVMMRFSSLSKIEHNKIKEYLKEKNAKEVLLDADKIKDLVVYGAGTIATDIIKKTNFFKKIKNFDLIDSDLKKVGNTIANKKIKSPEILKNDDRNIFIATALGYDEVFQNILSIKGSSRNIISGLIL